VGEKPLLYFEDGRTLAFASELKALRELHGGRLDRESLDVYFALGYGGNGITFSLLAAQIIRDLIYHKKNEGAKIFSFDR